MPEPRRLYGQAAFLTEAGRGVMAERLPGHRGRALEGSGEVLLLLELGAIGVVH